MQRETILATDWKGALAVRIREGDRPLLEVSATFEAKLLGK